MSEDTTYEQRIAVLNESFRKQLSVALDDLIAVHTAIVSSETPAAQLSGNLDELREIAHKLAGSAGIFECMSVAQAAARVESVVSKTTGAIIPDGQVIEVTEALEALIESIKDTN